MLLLLPLRCSIKGQNPSDLADTPEAAVRATDMEAVSQDIEVRDQGRREPIGERRIDCAGKMDV
jgi:hypothetical protein